MSSNPLTISIGTDHAGFPLKAPIIAFLKQRGHTVIDFGCDSDESCDYPDFIRPAAEVTVKDAANVLDRISERFGIRTVEWKPEQGMVLNGFPFCYVFCK